MLSTQAVRNLVAKYARLAGIEKNITPHVFRHTFASLLLEEGVDIKYIQDFLGHSSISTTQIYLHTTNKQKRKIIATQHPRQRLYFSDISPADNVKLTSRRGEAV
jgi:Site-specific recombinase XerD